MLMFQVPLKWLLSIIFLPSHYLIKFNFSSLIALFSSHFQVNHLRTSLSPRFSVSSWCSDLRNAEKLNVVNNSQVIIKCTRKSLLSMKGPRKSVENCCQTRRFHLFSPSLNSIFRFIQFAVGSIRKLNKWVSVCFSFIVASLVGPFRGFENNSKA